MVFQGCWKVQFFVFFCFCRLLWIGFSELVSVMERDLCCSMNNFHENWESRFWWRIGAKLLGERRDVEKIKLYEVGWRKGRHILASGEKLNFCFLLVRMCGVCLEFHSNQMGIEVHLDFFLSWTWRLILHCAKIVRKEIGGLVFAS